MPHNFISFRGARVHALTIFVALSLSQDTDDVYATADAVLNAVIMEYTVAPVHVLYSVSAFCAGYVGA